MTHHSVNLRRIILFLGIVTSLYGQADPARPRIGLALSGGGAKGLVHIGVLKVLEDKGIPIDCISGTSMGSIIGGLYAIGYDAQSLEKLAKTIEWDDLFIDAVSRQNLSMPEKEDQGRYIASLPVSGRTVALPSGLISGQKLTALLNRLTWPAHGVEDFNQFPIPFRCIAADIVTGEAVVLDHGHLSEAIRASMSIPTAFTPVDLDDRLLVDGGLVRNFPVSDVREMGADIVIGVDIPTSETYSKESRWSVAQIVNQAITLVNITTIENQRKACDILITPDLGRYTIVSFNAVDSLILLGEEAAHRMDGPLDSLARKLRTYESIPKSFFPVSKEQSVTVTSIKISGLKKVSRQVVKGRLMLKPPCELTQYDIDQAIDKVYGSGFFERVSYRLNPLEEGTQLIIEVRERTGDEIRFAVHHDSEYGPALLFGLLLRNRIGHGSRQLADVRLGDFFGFRVAHFFDIGWNPGLTLGTEYNTQEWQMPEYKNARLAAEYDMQLHEVKSRFEWLMSNSLTLGGESFYRWIIRKPSWIPEDEELKNVTTRHGGITVFLKMDDLDRLFFPHRGKQLNLEFREVPDFIGNDAAFHQFSGSFQVVKPLHAKWMVLADAHAGWIQGTRLCREHVFKAGGIPGPGLNFIPFPGFDFMSKSGRAVMAFKTGIRYEPRHLFYVTAEIGDLGIGQGMEDLLTWGIHEPCWSFSAGFLTPFGPLQWTLSGREGESVPLSWISLGYTF